MGRIAIALAFLFWVSTAFAHGMRTAYLELSQAEPGTWVGALRTTYPDPDLAPRFPANCEAPRFEGAPTDNRRSFVVRCTGALAGETVGFDGLGPIHTEAVVRVGAASRIVTPEAPSVIVPGARSAWRVAAEYVRLGWHHILGGADHLLFLLALVFWVRRWKIIALAETAFTLSHSLSFSLTALGIVRVSAAAAEACIALSLVILAEELGQDDRLADRTWRAPLLSFVFGAVHGLGFAGGLREVGIPEGAVAGALLGFGVGVELGQIAFLLIVTGLSAALARWAAQLRFAGSYAIGITGAYWLFERLWICFGFRV